MRPETKFLPKGMFTKILLGCLLIGVAVPASAQQQSGRTERKASASYRASMGVFYESPSSDDHVGLVIFNVKRGEKYARFTVTDDWGFVPLLEVWQDNNFNRRRDINGQDLWLRSCGPKVGPIRITPSIEIEVRVQMIQGGSGTTSGQRPCAAAQREGFGISGTIDATFSNLP